MKLVIQKVKKAKVEVENKTVGKIEKGYMVLLGVKKGDTKENADYLARKLCNLRIFEDENGKMNYDVIMKKLQQITGLDMGLNASNLPEKFQRDLNQERR